MPTFNLSAHVQNELVKRKIPLVIVEAILANPGQKVRETPDVICYQSQVEISDKTYLVRVMVNETVDPRKVITAYRTSRIAKYWEPTS